MKKIIKLLLIIIWLLVIFLIKMEVLQRHLQMVFYKNIYSL